jgi:hypothetical protein
MALMEVQDYVAPVVVAVVLQQVLQVVGPKVGMAVIRVGEEEVAELERQALQ